MSSSPQKRKPESTLTELPAEKKHKADAEYAALPAEEMEALEWEINCQRRLTPHNAATLRLLSLALIDPQSTIFKSLASSRLYDQHIPAALVKPFLVESVRVDSFGYRGSVQNIAVNAYKNRLEVLRSIAHMPLDIPGFHSLAIFSLDGRRRRRADLMLPDRRRVYTKHTPLPDGGAYLLTDDRLYRVDAAGKISAEATLENHTFFMSYDKVSGNLAVAARSGNITIFNAAGECAHRIHTPYMFYGLFYSPVKRRWTALPDVEQHGFLSIDIDTKDVSFVVPLSRPQQGRVQFNAHMVYDEKSRRFLAVSFEAAYEVDEDTLYTRRVLRHPDSWSLDEAVPGTSPNCGLDVDQSTGNVYVLRQGVVELFFAF